MKTGIYTVDSIFKSKCLQWIKQFEHFAFLNFNNLKIEYAGYSAFPCLLACGCRKMTEATYGNAFRQLLSFGQNENSWMFGYLSYDLKNEIEPSAETKKASGNRTGFPDMYFFIPEHILRFEGSSVSIQSVDPEKVYQGISACMPLSPEKGTSIKISQSQTKEEYLRHIEMLKQHLLKGDIYEINYCIEFFSEDVRLDPAETFYRLATLNPMPFSAFIRNKEQYILSASPERFLKKEGGRLISQPMKGTARRGATPEEDDRLKEDLKNSEKERAENMMITDLVRNDLARSSQPGTVKVEEIFGVYSFSNVHQMITTVTSEMRPALSWLEAITNAFPMGSMTGAPKIRAMELIDQYEINRRHVFSGAAGFIAPEKDFDLNVLIRSIMYDSATGYLSFHAGSAITYDSDPLMEYEECLLKAATLRRVLEGE